jgi:hypothetical protein
MPIDVVEERIEFGKIAKTKRLAHSVRVIAVELIFGSVSV